MFEGHMSHFEPYRRTILLVDGCRWITFWLMRMRVHSTVTLFRIFLSIFCVCVCDVIFWFPLYSCCFVLVCCCYVFFSFSSYISVSFFGDLLASIDSFVCISSSILYIFSCSIRLMCISICVCVCVISIIPQKSHQFNFTFLFAVNVFAISFINITFT